MVILGGYSCRSESNHTGIITCSHYNDDMMKIYEKEVLEEADKYRLVKLMKHMYNLCDYRFENLYTIKEQTEYLSSLGSEQLDEIYKQIEMHKLARSLYKDYH